MMSVKGRMLGSQSFECPHCSAFAQQIWHKVALDVMDNPPDPTDYIALNGYISHLRHISATKDKIDSAIMISHDRPHVIPSDRTYHDRELAITYFAECYSCKEVSLWVNDKLKWPSVSFDIKPNQDMPPDVAQDFMEAASVFSASPKSSAALLRLAMQKLLKHLGQKGKDINEDIAALVRKGLPVTIQQALDVVRVIGNHAVHPGKISLDDNPNVARQLFLIINIITEQMITQPRLIEEAFGALPDGVKEQIERRDTK